MAKAKRITLDLNDASATELEKLIKATGLTTANLFRYSLVLLRIYSNMKPNEQMRIVDPENMETQTRIVMPF